MRTVRTIVHKGVAIRKKEDGKYYVNTASCGFQFLRDAKAHVEIHGVNGRCA